MKRSLGGGDRMHGLLLLLSFLLYLFLLSYVLFFSEFLGRGAHHTAYRMNLKPFHEINRFLHSVKKLGLGVVLLNLLGNILVFLPMGFFMNTEAKRRSTVFFLLRAVAGSFVLSFGAECIQLIFRVGSFDLDDMILNTFGGLLGGVLYAIWERRIPHESPGREGGLPPSN